MPDEKDQINKVQISDVTPQDEPTTEETPLEKKDLDKVAGGGYYGITGNYS